jgi:hypothetical protein
MQRTMFKVVGFSFSWSIIAFSFSVGGAWAACGDEGTCLGGSFYCDISCGTGSCNTSITHGSCDGNIGCVDGKCVKCVSTPLAATVQGTTGFDIICVKDGVSGAGNGGITVTGKAGDDWIYTGSGADNITGDGGDDFISGGYGDDVIAGGDGNTALKATPAVAVGDKTAMIRSTAAQVTTTLLVEAETTC